MNSGLKSVLALAFVGVMGFVLVQPILASVDGGDREAAAPPRRGRASPSKVQATPEPTRAPEETPTPEPEPTPTPEPTPEPTPTPSPEPSPSEAASEDGVLAGPFRRQDLVEPYPKACLRRASAATSPGTIAVGRKGRLTVGSPSGRVATTGRADTPVGFDVTGRRLAALRGSQTLVVGTRTGTRFQRAGGARAWAWSPTSRCAVSIGRGGALEARTAGGRAVATLVEGNVKSFALSSDGRRLALVLVEGETTSVWTAKLSGTRMREIQRLRSGPRVSLRAWSPNGRVLYLSLGRDSGLSFVTTSDPPQEGGIVKAGVDAFEPCGDRLLGIVQGRIAELSKRGPEYLTARGSRHNALSCSPRADFIAAVRAGRLVLLDREGGFLRELATDRGYRDLFVDWGRRGAGLIFGRRRNGSKNPEVWYIPEGGTARSTGLTYNARRGVDWSGSRPTGIPIVWGG